MTKRAAPKSSYDAARVADLAAEVLRHKRLYYAGTPEISDARFDELEAELRAASPDHPALSLVGAEATNPGTKVRHDVPMLSLAKTYDRDELLAWVDGEPVLGSLKVDGVSLSLIYDEQGRLACAKTRGNGQVGEDVTRTVRWIADILPALPDIARKAEIRGEIFCTASSFVKLADQFVALGLERPTSPRNIVAGLLGRKTHVELARFFSFFAFQLVAADSAFDLETEAQVMEWLGARGFRLPAPRVLATLEEVDAYLARVREMSEEDEVGLDGAVFSYNRLARHRELGNTAHHPRYKMSFKWAGETATTVIEDIVWATSRLGIVTPVAVVKAVFLSGASITNVTLHNAAHVKAFNLKVGDEIEIIRSGEVIPKFLQVVTAAPGEFRWPAACDACKAALAFDDVRLKCPNTEGCPAQQLGGILNWIRAAEIDDLSDKRLEPLVAAGLVKSMSDLYRLQEADFLVIPQTKEKMAAKLFANVQRSRKLPLVNFLGGLGIEGAGATTWEKLLDRFPGLEALQNATAAEIADVHGFAVKSGEQIAVGLALRKGLIADLLAAGVTPEFTPAADPGDLPLSGRTIVLTGALSRPRSEVEKAIKAAGGKTAGAVSSATYAVVTDDPTSNSSKMKKARELGVLTWSEDDLWAALGG